MKLGPGLQRRVSVFLSRERMLPLDAEVCVELGQAVKAGDIVARATQQGDLVPVDVARNLSLLVGEVPGAMVKQVGDEVLDGEIIARTRSLFGLLSSECLAPCTGKLISISARTGQAMIQAVPSEIHVLAFMAGKVTEVIPQRGAVITTSGTWFQGLYGVGPERYGELVVAVPEPSAILEAGHLTGQMQGKVIVGGSLVTMAALVKAADVGVAAVLTGGLSAKDLQTFLGEYGCWSVTGDEDLPFTLVVGEGFGQVNLEPRSFSWLRDREGHLASVSGATQIRAGVKRPEIIVPDADLTGLSSPKSGSEVFTMGSQVRIVAQPFLGYTGSIAELPTGPQLLPSGIRALAAVVTVDAGQELLVPLANLEPLT